MEIDFEHGTLFYQRITDPIPATHTKRVLLLFPGVGQDNTIFRRLVTTLSQEYIFYSFDLFFHGKSAWRDAIRPIDQREWKNILSGFLKREGIERFEVLGYSIGGRLALATLEAFPDRTQAVYFIAGEGLRRNFWYDWATHPWLGKPLFSTVMKSGPLLPGLIRLGRRIGILSPAAGTLALSQVDTADKRSRTYGIWILLSKMSMSPDQLAHLAEQHNIPLHFMFGGLDTIMHPGEARSIKKNIPQAHVQVFETGHSGLIRKISDYLRQQAGTAETK